MVITELDLQRADADELAEEWFAFLADQEWASEGECCGRVANKWNPYSWCGCNK